MLLLRKNIFQSYHCKRLFIRQLRICRGMGSGRPACPLCALPSSGRNGWMQRGEVVCCGGGELYRESKEARMLPSRLVCGRRVLTSLPFP